MKALNGHLILGADDIAEADGLLKMALRSIRLTIAIGTAVILATIGSGSELLLERTKQTALHAAETRLQNVASVVENTINRQLLQVDSALVSLPPLFSATLEQKGEVDA